MTELNVFIPQTQNQRFYGVTIGVVTNNQDPNKLGRVKVSFPWFPEMKKGVLVESAWARVATPMAGKDRGIYCLPEVNDEVLVAFEHGQIEFPYILGSLWNGQDNPPGTNEDGKNNQRIIKSRSGHMIILDDTEGNEKIIIRDKVAKNEIVIDSKNNTMTIKVENGFNIEAKGNITFKSDKNLSIECKNFNIQSKEKVQITAKNDLDIQGKTVNIN